MGSHANGQLSFGIYFPEDYQFPWLDESVDNWWLKVKGFKPSFEPFDKNGNYVEPEPTLEQVEKWYEEKSNFLKENPLPFEEVTVYSYEYGGTLLAVPDTVITAFEGEPEKIKPSILVDYIIEGQALVNFIKKYFEDLDDIDMEPDWYLTAYYG